MHARTHALDARTLAGWLAGWLNNKMKIGFGNQNRIVMISDAEWAVGDLPEDVQELEQIPVDM